MRGRAGRSPVRRGARAALLCTLVALSMPLVAGAQPEPAEEPKPEAPATPTAIPVGQISSRAEALDARLEQIVELRPTKVLEQVEAQLADARQNAALATERAEALLGRRHNPSEIEVLSVRWRRLDAAFEGLEDRVDRQVDLFGSLLAELADDAVAWQETLREVQRARAPPVVEREVRRTLESLWSARSQVGSDLGDALELRDRIRQFRTSLAPTFERLALEKEEFAAGLLKTQDAPVWEALPDTELSALPGAVAAELSAIVSDVGGYVRSARDILIAQGVLLLALGWYFSRTRARLRARHPEGSSALDALRHPWAAAFLLVILLLPLLQAERGRASYLLLGPVAIFAWHRVLCGMVAPALRRPLSALAALMLVEIVRYVFIGVSMVDRALLVLDLALALAGIAWLRRPQRLQQLPWLESRSSWLRAIESWMQLAAPVLAAGIVAALLGYTNLADCIAALTIWGALYAAAWVAWVRIGEVVLEQVLEEGRPLLRVRTIRRSRQRFARILRSALRGVGVFAWAFVTLSTAGLWSPVRSAVAALLSFPFGYGPVAVSLGALLAFGVTLWLSWILSRFIASVLDEEVFSRVRMPPGVPFALVTFTRYTILVIGFVIAMGSIGFTLDRVTLLLSAVGVGIGFGLQNVVNNFVSGMILLFERPIRVGDWVQLGDLFGTVSSIGIRASKVKTFDGADVVVPNADFVSSRVTNWTLSDPKRRMILPVGVAYGTDPRAVMELLEQTARAHSQVLANPAPVALFRGFGDSALNFELRAFTADDWLLVSSDLYVAANEALRAAGVEIPFPQRDLHLRNADELRDALEKAPTALGHRASGGSGS